MTILPGAPRLESGLALLGRLAAGAVVVVCGAWLWSGTSVEGDVGEQDDGDLE